ncbi:MAG: glycosyltransferase family 2 protein [Lachnospiraceae bacterium]|nr:glycosyltransferase family 2 protein [Lachnospiraceae bacterium]
MELSVIVPVYNMASDGKLEYCIRSLVNQTLESMEVIAVDDASTDNSLEVLRELEKEFPGRLKAVASPENRRQGGARNLGLTVAQGDYIGFMDADDWVKADLYERMVKLAKETGADVVGTDMCLVYEHTMVPTERVACNEMNQTGILDHEKRKLLLLKPGPLGTKIYEREIFYTNDFKFPERISYEDNATAVEIVMKIKHFEHIPEANVFYYQRHDSTTHTVTQKNCEDRMVAMRMMLQLASKNGALEEFRDVVEYQYGILFYRNTLFSYMQGKMKKDVRFLKNLGKEMVETFPDFRENAFFKRDVNDYEMKLINLHLKSTRAFLFIYQLKQISKKIRNR